MKKETELTAYLEQGENKLNDEFPKYKETTTELFEKVYDFLGVDFEGLSDNRVYRHFLDYFKEIICFAFERDVSKAYLRSFFKIMNNKIVVEHITNHAKSKTRDIRYDMNSFVGFFIATWQGCDNDRNKILEEIIHYLDSSK